MSSDNVHFEEKSIKPEGYEIIKLISQGFHKASIIQDFPLQEKAIFLHVRKLRWYSESIGKIVERDWDTIAKGTFLTEIPKSNYWFS